MESLPEQTDSNEASVKPQKDPRSLPGSPIPSSPRLLPMRATPDLTIIDVRSTLALGSWCLGHFEFRRPKLLVCFGSQVAIRQCDDTSIAFCPGMGRYWTTLEEQCTMNCERAHERRLSRFGGAQESRNSPNDVQSLVPFRSRTNYLPTTE